MDADLARRCRAWIAHDPDEDDRAELAALLDTGDEQELAVRFTAPLRFGTAGIRGPMRAGPSGINSAVVRRTAAGLATHLSDGEVVVGHDARHRSRWFAEQVAAVLAGAGLDARLIDAPVPTPLLAFAVRTRAANAGVMVTASHNPAQDNGVKVYLGDGSGGAADGAQLVPPDDDRIERAIAAVGPADALPLGPPVRMSADELTTDYLAAVAPRSEDRRQLRLAYTPMHGVGRDVLVEALQRAGFAAPAVVVEQAEPDPDFPTVPFPNPEEPGALDLLRALVPAAEADLGLASDPDADRCAAVVPTPDGTARVLTGDEIGCLLADAVLRRRRGPVATSIVSSTLLPKLAARAGVPCHRTLTGFKWLVRAAPDLVFAYEEALGYAVAPEVVRDKDGISAAVLLAEFADDLRRDGRSLLDRLDELAVEFGLHATAAVSVRLDHPDTAEALMHQLRAAPPASLADRPVRGAEPLQIDDRTLPVSQGLVLVLDEGDRGSGRVLLRPSGTEPKLKAYLELVRAVAGDVDAVRARAAADLEALGAAVRTLLTERQGQASN